MRNKIIPFYVTANWDPVFDYLVQHPCQNVKEASAGLAAIGIQVKASTLSAEISLCRRVLMAVKRVSLASCLGEENHGD